ncbi:MAG: SGNH/GDSL hydrolase family protein [Alphaproteobacteria bacterium]|nr:SGNH/GDSL hydrolase family protein [Alphaproteobacteria bacterium]
MKRSSGLTALAFGALVATAAPAAASPFNAIYAFGDSLSDIGNVSIASGGAVPKSPPYAPGRFSNGPIWIDDVAARVGVPLTPALAGGTDFAFGGATTGTTAVHTAGLGDLPYQMAAFQTLVPTPAQNALYTLWIGANDLRDAFSSANPVAAVQQVVPQAVQNASQAVLTLAGLGAKHLLVLNLPNLAETPAIALLGNPQLSALATAASGLYDSLLAASLQQIAQTTGLQIDLLDMYALLNRAVQNPSAYGFADVTTPCWTGSTAGGPGTLCSTDKSLQDLHLFWDSLHPTEAGHALIARAALALIPEPGSVLLLVGGLLGLAVLRRRSRAAS